MKNPAHYPLAIDKVNYVGDGVAAILATNEVASRDALDAIDVQYEPLKAVVGVLILVFVALESHPQISRWALPPRLLPLGGVVSGFFGGLSGHQDALRSLFLLKAGLDKTAFIATGILIVGFVFNAVL